MRFSNSELTPERRKAAVCRLLEMHFKARVGHIGGNLSSLDAMLVVFHDFLIRSRQLHSVEGAFGGRAVHGALEHREA